MEKKTVKTTLTVPVPKKMSGFQAAVNITETKYEDK